MDREWIKLDGAKELDANLRGLEPKIAKKVTRQALRSGAKIVAAAVKDGSPVQSGAMRAAVKVRAGKSRKGSLSVLVTLGKGFFKGATFYGAFVAFGHKIGGGKGGKGIQKLIGGRWVTLKPGQVVAPNNFIELAYLKTADSASSKVLGEMKSGIEAVAAEKTP